MGQCQSSQCEYPDLVLMTFSAPSSAAILASSCSMFSKWRMKLYGRKQTEQNSEYGRQCPSYLGKYFYKHLENILVPENICILPPV